MRARKRIPHFSDHTIAAIVDGSRELNEGETHHLANCDRCAALYAELLSDRATWLGDRSSLTVDDDLVRDGLAVAGRTSAEGGGRSAGRRFMTQPRMVAASSLVVLLLVAGLWWMPRDADHPKAVLNSIDGIEERLVRDSASGLAFVVDGFSGSVVQRNGVDAAGMEDALVQLSDYYNNDAMRPDIAYWLIAGYLSTGQLSNAKAYVEEALVVFPDEARLMMLAGMLAYKQSDLMTAERYLVQSLELDPNDDVARFNLAVVLLDSGHLDLGLLLLDEVVTNHSGSSLAKRAANHPRSVFSPHMPAN